MAETYTIRLLTQADTKIYQELRLTSFREAPFAFSESYADEKKRTLASFEEELRIEGEPPEQFVLGIFETEQELVGFVKFRRDKRSKARHKSMVHAMYVKHTHRNQQLGKKLMEDLIARVRLLEGLEQIHLWVLHAQTSAASFYRKCGFTTQGPMVKKDLKIEGRYVDAEYMVRFINDE